MKDNYIERILDYLAEEHYEHVEASLLVFYGLESRDDLQEVKINEIDQGLFNEWLIFDAEMAKYGYTALEFILVNDVFNLNSKERNHYQALHHNRYSLFYVADITIGEGMRIEDTLTEEVYQVKEKMATYEAKVGQLFFTRIANIDGDYRFVGANPVAMPTVSNNLKQGLKKEFRGIELNPKYTFELLLKKNREKENNANQQNQTQIVENFVPLAEAERKLESVLKKYQLTEFFSIALLKDWIYNLEIDNKEPDCSYITIPVSLLDYEQVSLRVIQELVNAIMDFYPHIPQKTLGSRSPLQAAQENDQTRTASDINMHTTMLGNSEMAEYYYEASDLLMRHETGPALKKYQQLFQYMTKNRITSSFLYRIICNYALAYFYDGNEIAGNYFLKQALKLNPNYDFAITTKKRYEAGELDQAVASEMIKRAERRRQFDQDYDPDEINKWPAEKIVAKFQQFGVELNQTEFVAYAIKTHSVEQLSDQLIDPFFQSEIDWEEDFIWMGAGALWLHWCPDIPCHEIIMYYSDLLDDEFHPLPAPEAQIEIIGKLVTLIEKADKQILSNWLKMGEYEANNYAIQLTLHSNYLKLGLEKTLSLIKRLAKKTGDQSFLLAQLAIYIKENDNWRKEYEKLQKQQPLDYQIAYEAYLVFDEIEEEEFAEEFLLRSLAIINTREEKAKFKDDQEKHVLCENKGFVLERLIEFYKTSKQKEQVKEFRLQLKSVKAQLRTLASQIQSNQRVGEGKDRKKSFAAELEQIMEEMLIKKDAGSKYLQFITSYKLNFVTKELTTTEVTYSRPNGKKIGRNEPCPCGSRKKYKKCCGKNA